MEHYKQGDIIQVGWFLFFLIVVKPERGTTDVVSSTKHLHLCILQVKNVGLTAYSSQRNS